MGIRGGREYLDKIVQSRVSLPTIKLSQITKIFNKQAEVFSIEDSLHIFPGEQDRFVELYHLAIKFLLKTPRDVNKIFNRLSVTHPPTKNEIGISDLIALETIAVVAPPLYDHIRAQPYAYVGPIDETMNILKEPSEVIKGYSSDRQQALDRCSQWIRPWLIALLETVFPLLSDRLFGDKRPPRSSGRIACPENLLIALSGEISATDVALEQVRGFIDAPERREQIVAAVANINKLEDFLDLTNSMLRQPIQDPEGMVDVLANLAESEIAKEVEIKGRKDFVNVHISIRFFWVLLKIIESLRTSDTSRAKELIRNIFASPEKLAISTEFLRHLCEQQGIMNGKWKEPESSWIVSSEDLKGLKDLWVESTREYFIIR